MENYIIFKLYRCGKVMLFLNHMETEKLYYFYIIWTWKNYIIFSLSEYGKVCDILLYIFHLGIKIR